MPAKFHFCIPRHQVIGFNAIIQAADNYSLSTRICRIITESCASAAILNKTRVYLIMNVADSKGTIGLA
jgi:hypothetical protein